MKKRKEHYKNEFNPAMLLKSKDLIEEDDDEESNNTTGCTGGL
jgi:hypothetical protein